MTDQPPIRKPADAEHTGRTCPYCRFPIKEGVELVECGVCSAAHHAECWDDNHGCAIMGCAASPSGKPGEESTPAAEAASEPAVPAITGKPSAPASPNGAPPILRADHISKQFGGLKAVNDVSFEIPDRGIVSIIGPNGAGKTTFFNMLTGLYRPTTGVITFDGDDITERRPDKITKLGVARTFQNIRLFGTMTAVENVMVGQHARMKAGLVGSIFHTPRQRREEQHVLEHAREMLDYAGLNSDVFDQLAINLSYGDQRRVEIARALASDPRLLLLDEPTAGMNPNESAALTTFIRRLRDERGVTVLLIEHDMKVVMGVSERITVLDHGEKIAEGDPSTVRHDPRVIEAYLGKRESEQDHGV